MGKGKRYLILSLLFICIQHITAQDPEFSFRDFDHQCYDLNEQGEWKALASLCERAIDEGIDYYHLRIRAGRAYFYRERYARAAIHFRKALEFSEGDFVAGEYLYGCYLELIKNKEAYATYYSLPESSRKKLLESLPKLRKIFANAASITSNHMYGFRDIDLDGDENIYGEADITRKGDYYDLGFEWEFKSGYRSYLGYSFINLVKNKQVKTDDTLRVDHQYKVHQNQVYLNGSIPIGKSFSILPVFNIIFGNYRNVETELSEDSTTYYFPVKRFSYNYHITYLSLLKDFNFAKVGLFGSWSDLNEQIQYQYGAQATFFPLGNLNFYTTSRLLDHINDNRHRLIFEQTVGFRPVRSLWAEVSGTFGRMKNYYEKNAYVVYNTMGDMLFKGGAKIIYVPIEYWIVSIEYLYLSLETDYLSYTIDEDLNVVPVIKDKAYGNQVFLVGITLKF